MPCSIMHCRDVSHFAVPPAAQVPAQSQYWQASVLPTVGGPSTFQPYAMAPTVIVPVYGVRFAGSCPVTALAGQCIAHCRRSQHFPTLRVGSYGHSAGIWCQVRRFLPSHSTGRPVDYPLWEVPAPSNLTRWLLRSQCRYMVSGS